ncbi:MAG: hypothetical protein QF491_16360, partial [Alphaproteobacteria bacterium]|nr:hypothetical protein [Alphaproteobacteria bacterium]
MTNAPAPYRDPDATLRQLRARILGGARPPLESLGRDEMAAANRMISTGEAEIANYSCRLFLIAKLRDEPGGLDGLR